MSDRYGVASRTGGEDGSRADWSEVHQTGNALDLSSSPIYTNGELRIVIHQ